MRIAWLLPSFLLAALLGACSEAEQKQEETWNPILECQGVSKVLPLDGSKGPVALEASLGSEDAREGSCNPAGASGNDLVLYFRAGAAGHYLFTTEGSEVDTVLYAMDDCDDGFSELACSDDWGEETHSQLLLDLEQGQELFLVVDGVDVRQSATIKLSASRVEVTPPSLDHLESFTNLANGASGLIATGKSPFGPVVGFRMQLYTDDGEALFDTPYVELIDDAPFAISVRHPGDGTYEVKAAFGVNSRTPIGAIEFAVMDAYGRYSKDVIAYTKDPVRRERGEECDPQQARDVCPSTDACAIRAPSTEYRCVVSTTPTFVSARATRNLEAKYWGVEVEGVDPESDASGVRVLPRDEKGNPLGIIDSNPAATSFHHVVHGDDGGYRGVAAIVSRFDGPCYEPIAIAYNDCVRTTGNAEACYREAMEKFDVCYAENLAKVATVDVWVVDATNRISSMLSVPIEEAVEAAEGERCDPFGATASCPEDFVCWPEPKQAETCHENGPSCPSDFPLIDLSAHAAGGSWTYRGDTKEGAPHGGGPCGGGAAGQVFRFQAPSAGTYVAATSNLGKKVDTVVTIRSYCQLAAYTLACNDDAANGRQDSRVSFEVKEGETVFILVDSQAANNGGEYTLTVSRQ